jgi:hypothetical protein
MLEDDVNMLFRNCVTVYQSTRGDFTGDFILLQHRLENIKYRNSRGCLPVPLTARSMAWVCSRLPADIVCSNPVESMDIHLFWVLCVARYRGLCDGLITRPGESYWLWCVVACDLESSRMRRPWPALGCSTIGQLQIRFVHPKCMIVSKLLYVGG